MYPVRTHLVVNCLPAFTAVQAAESCAWDFENTKSFMQEPVPCMQVPGLFSMINPAAPSSREREEAMAVLQFEDCSRAWIICSSLE